MILSFLLDHSPATHFRGPRLNFRPPENRNQALKPSQSRLRNSTVIPARDLLWHGFCYLMNYTFLPNNWRTWALKLLLASFVAIQSNAVHAAAVDVYQDMESGTDGAALTGTIVSGGSHGTGASWGVTGSMNVATLNEKRMSGAVTVNGTNYADASGTRTWKVHDSDNSTYVSCNFPAQGKLVVSGFLTIGPPGGRFEIYDAIVAGTGSAYAVCQINSRSGGVDLWIETYPGSTQHSAAIPVTQGSTYWVSMQVDASGGTARLAVFDAQSWAQVGATVSVAMSKGTINLIRFGRGDSHPTTSNTYTYFDDMCVNWTDTTFPFVPSGSAPPPSGPDRLAGIPVSNAPTAVWAAAGVPGGIPARTTIYTTLNAGATASQIQAAINSCPANQVVMLGEGTFNVSNLTIGYKDDWVLRGAGMGKTILNVTSGTSSMFSVGGGPPWDGGWMNTVNITAGGAQGEASITVADASGYAVGDMCVIDQANTDWIVGSGTGGGTTATMNADSAGRLRDGTRVQTHYCRITSKTGNVLAFSPALPYSLETARVPQITELGDIGNGSYYRGSHWSGIEDLTLVCSGTSARGFQIIGTYAFWMKNVEVKSWGGLAAVWVRKSACFEMRGCYIHDPNTYAVDHGYGLQLDPTSGSLVTDNIIYNCQSTFLLQGGCDGNVLAYNVFAFGKYVNGGYTGEWLQHEINGNHTPFPSYNLFEGNYTGSFQADYYYGPSGWGTLFRNRISGNSSATTQHRVAVSIDTRQRNYSVVGNQLGERTAPSSLTLALPGVTRTYAQAGSISWGYDPGSASFSSPYIYRLGYPYSGNNGSGSGTAVHDSIVKTETLRHGNWDAANNAVVWDPAIADHTLPSSLYLPSKPSWFGNLAWPPYGPEAPTSVSSDLAKIPAGYRLLNGTNPPATGGDTTAPSVPQGLTSNPVDATQINLAWSASTDNIGVTGYRVERSQGAGSTSYSQVGSPTALTFNDTGLAAGTVYNYRVRAIDGAGNLSGYSTVSTATTSTIPDTTAPTIPASLAATVAGTTQVNLTWGASTDAVGVTGYRVERSQGAGSTTYSQVGTPTGTSFNDTGLTAATVYNYRVRATDAAGNLSGYTTIVTATTSTAPDTTAPTIPSSLAATVVGATQINLTWGASTDAVGVTGYRVERSQGTGSTSYTQVGTPAGASFNDTGLTAATVYNYRVRATDGAGNLSGYTTVVTATTNAAPDTTAPTIPTSMAATVVGSAQINLTWTASTDAVGVTGYRVERSQGAGSTTYTQVGTPSGASFNNTGLTASTVYNYRVRAVDAAGNLSGFSTVVTATTSAVPDTIAPTVPANLVATVLTSTQITLTWAASTDAVGVTGYRIERSQGVGSTSFAQIGTSVALAFSITDLTASTVYNFRVRAEDAAGNLSAYSGVVTATTSNPTSPTGLVAAYGFEEASGGTTTDASGNGNLGTITGATRITGGKYGKALSFDGTSNVVIVPGSSSLNVPTGMTQEAWIMPTASKTNWTAVLHRETDAYYLHASSPAGAMRPAGGAVFNGSEQYVAAPLAVPLNVWTHLATTYDGTILRIYINGSEVASRTLSGTVEANSKTLRIGGNTYSDQYFAGLIDEVRVYNRALSASEISRDMNTPIATRPEPPQNLRIVGQ